MTEIALRVLMMDSSDVIDLENWHPKKRDEVFFQITLRIRIGDNTGADDFQLLVSTIEGVTSFERRYKRKLTQSEQRILLLVEKFEWPSIRKQIEGMVDSCQAGSEAECNALLRSRFFWEYEGMTATTDEVS
jgi:Immunity protein 8